MSNSHSPQESHPGLDCPRNRCVLLRGLSSERVFLCVAPPQILGPPARGAGPVVPGTGPPRRVAERAAVGPSSRDRGLGDFDSGWVGPDEARTTVGASFAVSPALHSFSPTTWDVPSPRARPLRHSDRRRDVPSCRVKGPLLWLRVCGTGPPPF